MTSPETRYARSGDVNIAYQVVSDSGIDVVFIPNMTHHVELIWESPPFVSFLRRLGSMCRLIIFDKRGTGMSDRLEGGAHTLETRMDDIRAVMDAAGSASAVLFGIGDAGPLCALFAATYPERTSGLLLFNTSPRSRTSSTQQRERPSSVTGRGESSCRGTISSFGMSSVDSVGTRSTQPETGSSRPSTGRRAQFGAPVRFEMASASSASRSARASIPANASLSTRKSGGSPFTSEHEWHRRREPARCSSRARSRISSRVPGSAVVENAATA